MKAVLFVLSVMVLSLVYLATLEARSSGDLPSVLWSGHRTSPRIESTPENADAPGSAHTQIIPKRPAAPLLDTLIATRKPDTGAVPVLAPLGKLPTAEVEANSRPACPKLPPSRPDLPPTDNPGDPDYISFEVSTIGEHDRRGRWVPFLNRKVVRPDRLVPAFFKLPPVPPAPTGEAAMELAREQGWPDHWRARMRPQHFLLGPLKTGTTTLHACYERAMVGDPRKRAYPLATERWPLEYDDNGQAVIRPTHMMPEPYLAWNRTGARRFDVRKEWRVYHKAAWVKGEAPGLEKYHYLRFPPVEEGTKDWTMLDGTPFNLMTPGAADELKEDLKCAPFKPRFLVMNRDPLARGYSQFVMEQSLGYHEARGRDFYNELESQSTAKKGSLSKYRVCQMMMQEPEALMKDVRRVRQALQTCMHGEPPYNVEAVGQVIRHQKYVANLLPFGFVALGLKYWLHVFDYDASLFRVVDTSSLKGLDAHQMMGLVEDVFDMKRMLPRCPAVDSKEDGCTAWNRYDSGLRACGSQQNSWSGKEGFTMGDPEKMKKYRTLSDRWGKILDDLIVEYNITRWVSPAKTLPSP